MRKQTALCVLTQRMIVRSGSESYPVSVHTRAKTVKTRNMEFLCLVGTLGEDATNALLLPPIRLHGLRSMACCCHTLAAIVRAHYSSPHFWWETLTRRSSSQCLLPGLAGQRCGSKATNTCRC